jgi:hypothetical protein
MKFRFLKSVAVGAAIAAAGVTNCVADDLSVLKAQLAEARADVRSHTGQYDTQPDGSQAARDAVEREWTLIEQVVAAELDANLDVAKQPVSDGIAIIAVALAADTWLISADIDGLGTVFVVKQSGDRFKAVWNIRQLNDQQTSAFPLLAGWSAGNAMATCTQTCGPMRADIASLGESDDGKPRFYLDAYYTSQEGNDVGYQLSVWMWDGGKAVPLIVHDYMQTIDGPAKLEFSAPFLRLHEKDAFKTVFVAAPELGRQMEWTALMEGDSVHDLGRRSLVPELDAVDDLLARILKHKSTESIATPKVATFVGDALRNADLYVDSADPDDIYGAVGELWVADVVHRAPDTIFCFSADNLDNLAFTLQRKESGYFITRVRRVTEHDAGKSGCRYWKP